MMPVRSEPRHIRALRLLALACVAILFSETVPGCKVQHRENGDDKKVDVSSPIGDVHVHTNKAGGNAATGLSAYPGAVPAGDKGDDDNGNADVGLSFGNFKLGVHAAGYQTSDGQDKVLAFYRKDMAQYGDVLECRHGQAVGSTKRTSAGLSCSEDKGNHMNVSNDDEDVSLRAGSPEHQHIVGLQTRDGGTHIGLVALDLPHDLGYGAGKTGGSKTEE